MDAVTFLAIVAIISAVCMVLAWPWRRPTAEQSPAAPARADLEAARDAKLREIRDAELDHALGKLSDPDFEAVHNALRAEAVEILHQLDALP